MNHIFASYSERVTQQGIIDAGFLDHQLIFCTIEISKVKTGFDKQIKVDLFKHYRTESSRINCLFIKDLMTLLRSIMTLFRKLWFRLVR